MPAQRFIPWTAAMHELSSERRRPQREPLRTPSGGYDKTAILQQAHRWARQMSPAAPYAARLAISLRGAWEKARKAGLPYSPRQVDRSWPLARLVANARTGARP